MSKATKIISFIGLTIAMFMGTLDSTIVNIVLPQIMTHFNASLTDTSWVATTYTLALAVFMITGSKIADRYGRKKIMLLGLALFGGFSAACMLATSLPELIAFRFFQGLGGAIITPIVLPMGIEIFGKAYMSKIASVVGAVTALAAAGGPPIGGVIIKYASWRWVFGINVPLTIVAFLIIAMGVRESYDESLARRIDLPQPQKGTDLYQVYQAQKKLALATDNLKAGNQQLALTLTKLENQNTAISKLSVASQKINLGNQKISQGQKKLLVGLKQLAQKEALTKALRKIKHTKNQQISQAFSHTYLVGAVIVLVLSPIALLTDRKSLKS